MRRIFLDTNFVIDYLLRPEYKVVSQRFLEHCAREGCKLTISTLSIANFAYISRKLPSDELYNYLEMLISLFELSPLTERVISRAIKLKFEDFEDAIQYQCAVLSKADCIISRNAKDFKDVSIPVLSAEEYLERHL